MKNRNLFSKEMLDHVFSYFHPIDSNKFIIIININWCNRLIIKILNSAFPNFIMCYRSSINNGGKGEFGGWFSKLSTKEISFWSCCKALWFYFQYLKQL